MIADARAREVNSWFAAQSRDLGALADNASLQIYFATLSENENDVKQGGQADYLRNLMVLTSQRLGFEPEQKTVNLQLGANMRKLGTGGLALVTLDRDMVMATDHMPPLDKALLDKLMAAPRGQANFFDTIDNDSATPRLVFSVPVYGVQGAKEATSQMGILVGIRPLADVYGALSLSQPAPEKTLEVALVRAEEETAHYLSPLVDASPLLSQREEGPASAANFALANPEKFGKKLDYRGKEVLFTSRPIPEANWLLMAKVDTAEALGATLAKRNSIVAAIAMLMLALVATVVALWRHAVARQQALLANEYGAQAELLSVVTDNQQDPLYIVDAQMQLHFTNQQAATLMNSTPRDLKGKSLANSIGSAFAATIEPALAEALRSQQVQTMELSRGIGKKLQHLCLRMIPLAHIPVPGVPQPTPGVLLVEQDTTEVVQEREIRLSTLNQLVAMLVSLVDKRDPNAAQHSARVAILARATAEAMGLAPTLVETTETAARLMNLGKVDVPVELLTRDGKLNDAERDAIRSSLTASAELLKGVAFRGPVCETLLQAQELVDGSGAMKLKGDAILISARIVAAANALVGMVSPRAYRAPLSIDAALKILQTETDRRYDRKVVTALAHYVENQGGDKLLEHKAAA